MTTQTQSKDAVRGFLAHLESTDNADSLRHFLKTFVAARASGHATWPACSTPVPAAGQEDATRSVAHRAHHLPIAMVASPVRVEAWRGFPSR